MKTCTAAASIVVALGTTRCVHSFLSCRSTTAAPSAVFADSRGRAGQHISHSRASVASRAKQERRETALSAVSVAFGEKVNTDKVVMDKAAAEVIGEVYSEPIGRNPGFLEAIGHGDASAYTEDELRRKLELAHIFVNLANLVILSRGRNILSNDFKYYSPGTGELDRDAFLRLTKTVDVGFSEFKKFPKEFTVYKDGVVSYRLTFKTVHNGYLVVGDKTYPPTSTKVVSDVDLCTVSFNAEGLVQSYTYGLMVDTVEAVEDLDAVAEIVDIEKRMENQIAKMASLEGQETSIAYTKCKSDIDTMLMDKETLEEKVNSKANTMGLGGIPGLFAAVGADFPKDLKSLEGTDACGEVEGQRPAVFSFPSEVRDYGAFDNDSFNELQP